MPKVTYVEHDGTRHEVDVAEGSSAMLGAVDNGVPGILGDCGGSCSCATCHVYVDEAWQQAVGGRSAEEDELLSARDDMAANSRLSCQIPVTAQLDGLVLHMPEEQY